MAQTPSRTCRNCGAPLLSGQRFCSSCGTSVEEGTSSPTTPSNESYSPVPDMQTIRSNIPVPIPPPPPSLSSSGQAYTQYPEPYIPEAIQGSQTPLPSYQPQPTPDYAKPQSSSAMPVLRRLGCGLGVLLILFLALCGTGGYFAFHAIQNALNHHPSGSASNSGGSQATGGGYGSTATSGKVTTMPINETITYASITITILDAKQAQSFSDDTSSNASSSVLRLDLKEQNATSVQPNYLYSDIMRLILPDQNSVSPLNAQEDISPNASTTRTNWIDFSVPTTTNVSQTTLQFGDGTQAQMSIPLTSNADLTKYQAKTATISKYTQYGELKWSIKTATRSWSNEGKQATKGMYYVILDMSIDNPSTNDYTAVWGDYIRMSAGTVTNTPDSNHIPTSFAAGSSGTEATAAFLVPQTATSYTFILLPQQSYTKTSQETITFQV